MPPHIFAVSDTAYTEMLQSKWTFIISYCLLLKLKSNTTLIGSKYHEKKIFFGHSKYFLNARKSNFII